MKYHRCLISCISIFLTTALLAAEPEVRLPAKHRSLFEAHCLSCHGAEKPQGNFRLDDLPFAISTIETAEKWQKILNAMNSGEMPPEDEKQPPNEMKADFLDDLSNAMVAARRVLSDQQGVITMRRLNRREYKNTLRELLGVEINVAELPSDTGTGGFDTFGSNLFMSANQFEQYQSLGLQALDEAFTRSATMGQNTKVPELVKFGVGNNRQVGSVTAKGVNKVRYECETANEKVSDYVAYTKDARERAQQWKAAVEAAAAKPENAEIVAALKKAAKNDAMFRRSWDKIPGAPNPRMYGFDKKGENDADLANDSLGENWQKYHEYYLSRPQLESGAYLGTPTMHPAVMALGFLQLPVPGEWLSGNYVFRVRLAAAKEARPEQKFLEMGMHPRNGMVRATFAITGTMEQPQIVEMPFTLTKTMTDGGDRTLFIREKGAWDNNEEGGRKRSEAVKRNGIGPEAVLWIDWMEIERVSDTAVTSPGLLALEIPLDDVGKVTSAEVKPALRRFCAVAFRGAEPPASFVDKLAAIYDTQRKAGVKHSSALKETLSVVLASPMFLYLAEPAKQGTRSALTGIELANRLSYFLWSAPPDETLIALAKSGELLKPEVLASQTTRLLDDERSEAFVQGFVNQWLGMDRLDFFQVNRTMHPRFDDATKLNAREEVFATFTYLLKQNSPLSDLLKADYVVVNQLLAEYYGIQGAQGDSFQKVKLPTDSPRGGLLGMAAIHFMGGNGERTSPVERGAWVLRKLLNDPPPPAPANVPQLARLAGKVLTTHERLKAHQADAQCASCHRKIDPIGFGLENFDAVGLWRTQDTYQVMDEKGKPVKDASKTWTIETAAQLHNGPAFKDFFELREIIASKSNDFAKGFSTSLIEYGLGRPIGFRDEPLLADMLATAKQKQLGLRTFIQSLVNSKEFHTK
jgi:mono/diheme cytochrome c family protein